jgi:hypothetical protein
MYESNVDYKLCFNVRLDAYKASVNLIHTPEDIGIDFLYGLDNSRHAVLKAVIENDIQKGILTQPKDLNTIYVMASRSLLLCQVIFFSFVLAKAFLEIDIIFRDFLFLPFS